MPRMARSRSQNSGISITDDDRISQGANSYILDEVPDANEEKFVIDIKETNG